MVPGAWCARHPRPDRAGWTSPDCETPSPIRAATRRKVNPVVPVQLIVDHSLAVEYGGFDKDAFAEESRGGRSPQWGPLPLHRWTKKAFKNVDVIPAGNGIMHQINLERMSPVIGVQDGVAYPDTCVGTDITRRTSMRWASSPSASAASGSRERDAGPRVVDAATGHRRRRASGKPQPGITATDVVLALTGIPAQGERSSAPISNSVAKARRR